MRFKADHYYRTALERMKQSVFLYGRGNSYALSMYVAGLAVECILRAFVVKKDPAFDERHDLLRLFEASGMLSTDAEKIRERGASSAESSRYVIGLRSAVNAVYVLWSNSYRFASENLLRSELRKRKLHLGIRGDFLKENARRLIAAAQTFVDKGVLVWTSAKK